jgi:hypothetical protein
MVDQLYLKYQMLLLVHVEEKVTLLSFCLYLTSHVIVPTKLKGVKIIYIISVIFAHSSVFICAPQKLKLKVVQQV